jgi:hypothetical protein
MSARDHSGRLGSGLGLTVRRFSEDVSSLRIGIKIITPPVCCPSNAIDGATVPSF